MTPHPPPPFTVTVLGSPRIGPNRELKRATEGYWAGRVDRAALDAVAAGLRRDTWRALVRAGLDSIPRADVGGKSRWYHFQWATKSVITSPLP